MTRSARLWCLLAISALAAGAGTALHAEDTLDLLWQRALPTRLGGIAFSMDHGQYALSIRDSNVVFRVSDADGRILDTLHSGDLIAPSDRQRRVLSMAYLGERLVVAAFIPSIGAHFECYDPDSTLPFAVRSYRASGMFLRALNMLSLPTADSMLYAERSISYCGKDESWSMRTGFLALRGKDSIDWWRDNRDFYAHAPTRSYDGWTLTAVGLDDRGWGLYTYAMDVRSPNMAIRCQPQYTTYDQRVRTIHPTGDSMQAVIRLHGGAARMLDNPTCTLLGIDDMEPVANVGPNGVMLVKAWLPDSMVAFRVVDLTTMRMRELVRLRVGPYFCLDHAYVQRDRLYIAYDTTLLCYSIRRSSIDTTVSVLLSTDTIRVGEPLRATVMQNDPRRSASYRWFANDVLLAQTSTPWLETHHVYEGSFQYSVEVLDSSGSTIERGRSIRPLVVLRWEHNLYRQPIPMRNAERLSLSSSGRYLAVETWDSVFVVALHDTGSVVHPRSIAQRGHGLGVFKPGTDSLWLLTTSFVPNAAPSPEIRFNLSVGVPPLFVPSPVTSFTILDSSIWRSVAPKFRGLEVHLSFDSWSKQWIVGAAGLSSWYGLSMFLGAWDPGHVSDSIAWFIKQEASPSATTQRLRDISAGPAPWVSLCFDSSLRGYDVVRRVDTTFMMHERPQITARFVDPKMVLTTIGVFVYSNGRWEPGGYFPREQTALAIVPSTHHAVTIDQDSQQFGLVVDLRNMTIKQRLRGSFPYSPRHIIYDSVRNAVHVADPNAAVSGWKLVDMPVTSVGDMEPTPGILPIMLHPNPATDHVSIRGLVTEPIVRAESVDLMGRVLPLAIEGDVVNVSTLPTGFYVLRLTTVLGSVSAYLSVAR